MRTLRCAVSATLLLLVALGVVWAQSQPLPPRPLEDSQKKQPTPKDSQQNTTADKRGTDYSPLVVKVLPTPNVKEESEYHAVEIKEKSANERRLVIFTALIFCVGVVQTIVFGLQAHRLRQTIDEMKIATDATIKAANAAKESADAAVKTAMPVLFPWITDMTRLHPLTASDSEITHTANIFIGFDNFGKTPGMIRQVRAELFLTEMDTLPKVDFENLALRKYQVMIPGKSHATNQFFGALDMQQTIKFTPLELQELFAEARGNFRRFSLIGQVIYDDFFGLRHTSRFCVKVRMWRVNGTSPDVRCFQVAQGGSEYNQITSEQIPMSDPLAKV
jgi:hypothetical protein